MMVFTMVLLTGYTVLQILAVSPNTESNICRSKGVKSLLLWSSSCFYQTRLLTEKASLDELITAKIHFDRFKEKGGVNSDLLWFRLKFFQYNAQRLRINYQEIHFAYEDYLRSDHINLNHQVDYLYYLNSQDLALLAQTTLDNYCGNYLPPHRNDVVDVFAAAFRDLDLSFSLDQCNDILDMRSAG